jgi:hypothetical protein
MSLTQKEKAIREKRTILAASKNLVGLAGKLGTIARYLGHPIRYQGSSLADSRSLDDYMGEPYDVYAQNQETPLPTFDAEADFIETIGYVFDGLSRGIHMEIKYIDDTKALTVYWKGYLVYREIAGDLFAYAPFDEWEDKISKLYEQSKKIAIRVQGEKRAADEEEARKNQKSFLQRLRLRWGI